MVSGQIIIDPIHTPVSVFVSSEFSVNIRTGRGLPQPFFTRFGTALAIYCCGSDVANVCRTVEM